MKRFLLFCLSAGMLTGAGCAGKSKTAAQAEPQQSATVRDAETVSQQGIPVTQSMTDRERRREERRREKMESVIYSR